MSEELFHPTLMTFAGATLSGVTSGIISLNSDLVYGPVSSISLPKGLQMKIWGIRVSGSQITVARNFAKTYSGILVSSVLHGTVAFNPTTASPMFLEKNRPVIVQGVAGGETINLTYAQLSTPLPSFVEMDVEFSEM